MMKLLLTDSGVQNPNITGALVDLLGKPIAESTALFIPTALHTYNYHRNHTSLGGQPPISRVNNPPGHNT